MDLIKNIETLIEPALIARGYALVRIQLSGAIRKVLQIMIERQDDRAITVDDCALVSRVVSVLLDQHNVIEDQYTLELSSAGLDRPLVKIKDYERFKGQNVVVKTNNAINGQKKFYGLIQNVIENDITLTIKIGDTEELENMTIPLMDIRSAKLDIDFEAVTKKNRGSNRGA